MILDSMIIDFIITFMACFLPAWVTMFLVLSMKKGGK